MYTTFGQPLTGRRRLICYPHAGAWAAVYHRWTGGFPDLDVIAARLLGRDNLFGVPAIATGQSEDELYRQMARSTKIPLGRAGRPEESAGLAAYLLSDRSSYVTGSAINLDGRSSPVR